MRAEVASAANRALAGAGTVEAAIHVDWWANIYLNGQKLRGCRSAGEIAEDGAEFSTFHAVRIPLPLQAGENVLLVKNHSGSRASGFCLYLNAPESVRPASVKPGGPGSS